MRRWIASSFLCADCFVVPPRNDAVITHSPAHTSAIAQCYGNWFYALNGAGDFPPFWQTQTFAPQFVYW